MPRVQILRKDEVEFEFIAKAVADKQWALCYLLTLEQLPSTLPGQKFDRLKVLFQQLSALEVAWATQDRSRHYLDQNSWRNLKEVSRLMLKIRG